MKVWWCQRPSAVVVVVVLAVASTMVRSSHAQDLRDSFEASNEAFRPSSLFINSPSAFRPMPRGGRSFDFSSPVAPPSGSVFPPFPSNTFPSTSFSSSFPSDSFSSSSHESSSSYINSPPSPSPGLIFSSPPLSFPSAPSSSYSSVIQAVGTEILDVSAQDSRESLGIALSSALGFPMPGFTPVRNKHGFRRLNSPPSRSYGSPPGRPHSLSQTYGPPPPRPSPVQSHKPHSLSQTYGPPPKPTSVHSLSQSYGPPPKPTPVHSLSQSYGPPPKPTPVHSHEPHSLSQNYGPSPQLTPAHSISQTYGPPPQPTPAHANKRPSLSQTHEPPPPRPTPFAAYYPPSPTERYSSPPIPTQLPPAFGRPSSSLTFDSRSRERFISSEFPHSSSLELGFGVRDNSFDSSVESFIGSSFPSKPSSGFNSPSITFSGPRDKFSSHEISVHATSPKPTHITFSSPRNGFSSHEALKHPATIKSAPDLSFLSPENFNSLEDFGSSARGFSTPSSLLVTPTSSFQHLPFGSHTPHDSRQSSSAELFLRTSDQPKPFRSRRPTQHSSVKVTRLPQTSFVGTGVGGHKNYYFSYNVNDSVEDNSSAFGKRRKKGPNFGHSERRDGQRTEGTYYVELPDGRTQVVEYYADETGYHPTITYV